MFRARGNPLGKRQTADSGSGFRSKKFRTDQQVPTFEEGQGPVLTPADAEEARADGSEAARSEGEGHDAVANVSKYARRIVRGQTGNVLLDCEIPRYGTPVERKRCRSAGDFVIGYELGTSPGVPQTQYLARKQGSNEFYLLKILSFDPETEIVDKETLQGKVLLHNEFSLLSMLDDVDGVIHQHGFFSDYAFEERQIEHADGTVQSVYTGRIRRRLILVLDCVHSHEFAEESGAFISLHRHILVARISEREALALFYEVVKVVEQLHARNIIHRDLKLNNIVLDRRTGRVVLTNFFLGKHLINEQEHLFDQRGSPAYISPDVLGGKPYLGKPSDMWALGVILYTIVYGKFPFLDTTPTALFRKIREVDYTIPSACNTMQETKVLIKRMLTLNPDERLTATEVRTSLEQMLHKSRLPRTTLEQLVPEVPDKQRSSAAGGLAHADQSIPAEADIVTNGAPTVPDVPATGERRMEVDPSDTTTSKALSVPRFDLCTEPFSRVLETQNKRVKRGPPKVTVAPPCAHLMKMNQAAFRAAPSGSSMTATPQPQPQGRRPPGWANSLAALPNRVARPRSRFSINLNLYCTASTCESVAQAVTVAVAAVRDGGYSGGGYRTRLELSGNGSNGAEAASNESQPVAPRSGQNVRPPPRPAGVQPQPQALIVIGDTEDNAAARRPTMVESTPGPVAEVQPQPQALIVIGDTEDNAAARRPTLVESTPEPVVEVQPQPQALIVVGDTEDNAAARRPTLVESTPEPVAEVQPQPQALIVIGDTEDNAAGRRPTMVESMPGPVAEVRPQPQALIVIGDTEDNAAARRPTMVESMPGPVAGVRPQPQPLIFIGDTENNAAARRTTMVESMPGPVAGVRPQPQPLIFIGDTENNAAARRPTMVESMPGPVAGVRPQPQPLIFIGDMENNAAARRPTMVESMPGPVAGVRPQPQPLIFIGDTAARRPTMVESIPGPVAGVRPQPQPLIFIGDTENNAAARRPSMVESIPGPVAGVRPQPQPLIFIGDTENNAAARRPTMVESMPGLVAGVRPQPQPLIFIGDTENNAAARQPTMVESMPRPVAGVRAQPQPLIFIGDTENNAAARRPTMVESMPRPVTGVRPQSQPLIFIGDTENNAAARRPTLVESTPRPAGVQPQPRPRRFVNGPVETTPYPDTDDPDDRLYYFTSYLALHTRGRLTSPLRGGLDFNGIITPEIADKIVPYLMVNMRRFDWVMDAFRPGDDGIIEPGQHVNNLLELMRQLGVLMDDRNGEIVIRADQRRDRVQFMGMLLKLAGVNDRYFTRHMHNLYKF